MASSVYLDRFNRREKNGHFSHVSSPKSPDVDFADVFGGPPRRFSTQDFRYSFGEPDEDSKASPEQEHDGKESPALSRNPWTGLEEKTVFGSFDVVSGRRYPSCDFYDDIFRGDESSHSLPRKSDNVPTSPSSPSSFLGPVRPLPPKSDPFATSFPSQYSLPAKSTGQNFSPVRSSIDSDEASSSSPARQSSVNLQKDDDLRSESRASYRPSPLSHECLVKGENKSDEVINNDNAILLHFSIFKWAGKGSYPSLVLLSRSNSSKSNRKNKIHRSSSSNGRRIQDSVQTAEFLTKTEAPETPARTVAEDLNKEEQRKGILSSSSPGSNHENPKPKSSKDSDDSLQTAKLPNHDTTSQGLDDSQGKPSSSENPTRIAATKGGGKVRDFVNIFNQQQQDHGNPQTSTWKQHVQDQNKNKHQDQNKNKLHPKNSFNRRTQPSSDTGPLPNPSATIYIDMDDLMEETFQVKELPSTDNNQEMDLDLDDKIRKWARGKEGNIRSLLSTLQFVLWENSGWKPVALVDIIEVNSVKRAYQRALLYLHPDKLQQKCSAPHQKHIAEKVFKIVQEAWDHFNTLGAI